MTPITYRTADVSGLKVFYRESGPPTVQSCCCCTAARRGRSLQT